MEVVLTLKTCVFFTRHAFAHTNANVFEGYVLDGHKTPMHRGVDAFTIVMNVANEWFLTTCML